VAAVARRAAVSRTFLYDNPEARAAVATATATADDGRPSRRRLTSTQDPREPDWRERALNAEDALKTAHGEIRTQRTRIGELLGQIRDIQTEWTPDAIQRITTENTTLKQRLRQATADNRALEERLQAARSNLRFQDRRLADLEARLADPTTHD
jgi:chromosome segregation ATPase